MIVVLFVEALCGFLIGVLGKFGFVIGSLEVVVLLVLLVVRAVVGYCCCVVVIFRGG